MFKEIKETIVKQLTSPNRKRIAYGAFWGMIGTISTRIITVVLSFLLARILGKELFGEYGIINTTASMVNSFAGLGIGVTVTRYIASLKNTNPERAGRIIALSSIVTWCSAIIYGSLLFLFAPWLAEKTLAAPHLGKLLQISSITIAFSVINSVQTSTLTGVEAFKSSSILSTVTGILQSLLVVIFAYLFGIKGAITALAASSFIIVLFYYFVSRSKLKQLSIKIDYKNAWREKKVLIKYSLPAFLSTITMGPTIWASNAFLANAPNGYGQLGIYNAAMQWDTFLRFFPALISTAVLPVMSDLFGKGDKKGSLNLMWKMMKITAFIVIPIAIIISFCSPLLIKLYGKSFEGGHWAIVLVVFTTVFSTISAHLGTYIVASGKMWIGFAINVGWAAVFILLSYLLVKWGAEGLAGARLLAYILHFIWSLYICYKLSKQY
jgi:O-antigen/teichoic acid export membrane protein